MITSLRNRSPLNYSTVRKWIIVLIVSLGSACVTCASSAVTLTYSGTEAEFHSSSEVTILGLSLFVLGLGIGPLFLGPLSEFYGRRPSKHSPRTPCSPLVRRRLTSFCAFATRYPLSQSTSSPSSSSSRSTSSSPSPTTLRAGSLGDSSAEWPGVRS